MPRLDNNKDRMNTVSPQLTVYRISRQELTTNIVSLQGGSTSGDGTAYLRFRLDAASDEWDKFKNWWKKNSNLIFLGCKVWNVGGGNVQNKGYYWCPTNRVPNPIRTDGYTKYLEFFIQRNDSGIFNDSNQTIYEFYFINLTH